MSENENPSDVAALTVQLLSAYLANNTVPSADLAGLIQSTKAALTQDAVLAEPEAETPTFTAAVSARKSLASPDHIISLIDGKPYKTLKRHLATHGLTPETYRERYGLPASYPMVAPAFAAMRRAIAEKIGLGTNRTAKAAAPADAVAASEDAGDVQAATPIVPKAKKPAAKTSAVNAAKAPARKAKTTSKSTPAAADTATDQAPEIASSEDKSQAGAVTAETPAAAPKPAKVAAGDAKLKKPPTKRMARSPKTAAKPAAGNTEAETAAAAAPSDAPLAEQPKRRGKLGLFGNESVEANTPATGSADGAKTRWKRPGTKAK